MAVPVSLRTLDVFFIIGFLPIFFESRLWNFGRLCIANKNALLYKSIQQGAEKAKQTAFRFFHPDYTVGPGITPDQRLQKQPVAGLRPWPFTAGGELHPALKQTFWKVL